MLNFAFQARSVKRCMNEHDECLSYEIVAGEAHENEVEEGDMMIQKKRMIINPEYVEGLDTSDGAKQYDDDVDLDEEM